MFIYNKNFRSIFGFIIVIILGSHVSAGELGTWTGWYTGAFGSYVSGKLNSDNPAHAESTKDYNDDMPMIGIFGGYHRQFESGWVAGVEVLVPIYMKKGTATDKKYYPDSVKYEARYSYGMLLAIKGGRNFNKLMPYAFYSLGFMKVDGKTINVDENDLYSEGAEQSAAATHFIWQLGAGVDYLVSETIFMGLKIGTFRAARADHTMPWNEPGPNNFGYKSFIVQFHGGYRF